jgi:dTDP-4-amino-4,6-dideoxygalactose transaminase
MKLENFLLQSHSTIKEAYEAIEQSKMGLCLLIDKNGKFIRTITDGDLRRLIIKCGESSVSLEYLDPIQPLWADKNEGVSKLLEIMKEHDIQHLPILDDDFKPIDVVLRKNIEYPPVLLSSPHMGENEINFIHDAFETNWIAPLGPNVENFELEFARKVQSQYALALSSGTAALHLALVVLGVTSGDIVFCSSLTFVASANPILYQGATPVFIDSELDTWNMCPLALERALKHYGKIGKLPKAVMIVNLYGQSADMDTLVKLCDQYEVPIIEDAAESLGAKYKKQPSGTFGKLGVYSFNGNKIITTSGGGMLVSEDENLIKYARFLSTQSKDPGNYYLHSKIGYNYRMSNILAGVGRGQLIVLDERIHSRRAIFNKYVSAFKEMNIFDWMPEPEGYFSTRWLSCGILQNFNGDIDLTLNSFTRRGIEVRRIWKPLHTQPLFKHCDYFEHEKGNSVSDFIFANGLCLPSGSNLSSEDQARVINQINRLVGSSK